MLQRSDIYMQATHLHNIYFSYAPSKLLISNAIDITGKTTLYSNRPSHLYYRILRSLKSWFLRIICSIRNRFRQQGYIVKHQPDASSNPKYIPQAPQQEAPSSSSNKARDWVQGSIKGKDCSKGCIPEFIIFQFALVFLASVPGIFAAQATFIPQKPATPPRIFESNL